MKIVNIIGGLGNQLFQYAFAIGRLMLSKILSNSNPLCRLDVFHFLMNK